MKLERETCFKAKNIGQSVQTQSFEAMFLLAEFEKSRHDIPFRQKVGFDLTCLKNAKSYTTCPLLTAIHEPINYMFKNIVVDQKHGEHRDISYTMITYNNTDNTEYECRYRVTKLAIST